MKKIAIIGASYLQEPLIVKAKKKGIETHVFAWACGDVGEGIADYFYPISIVEKEEILKKCQEIGVDGICSIASDLAAITVNYVANKMDLIGNSLECTDKSTNKALMRQCFENNGDPSPKSVKVRTMVDLEDVDLQYPVIVKPVDRSGSRGITKLSDEKGLATAIENAKEQGFEKAALVEEFAEGQEYSVEYISWKGKHEFLAMTKKYTTGSPHFIETGHLQPAPVSEDLLKKVQGVVEHALCSLEIEYGASHSEIKIDENGNIKIIEIGGRMGGDFIGSTLVELSTGFDFVAAVIDIAMGEQPDVSKKHERQAAVRFIFSEEDIKVLDKIKQSNPTIIFDEDVNEITTEEVLCSGDRFGYFIFHDEIESDIAQYLI